MLSQKRLSLETLERRDVPAQFGIPWADGSSVTVSFAPNGADVDGSPNKLDTVIASSGLSPAAWKAEVLKAFQSWADASNINIGVVGDDGSALGAPGYVQADARFGDIRIFAAPLSSSVLAITTPPGDLGGTRTGDIILNSNYNFGIGSFLKKDLYTVFLQEGGHALGIGNSPDTSSAMYEFYQGTRTSLSSGDVESIRDLYGIRPSRVWEPASGNDSSATATALLGSGSLLTYGDIASNSDFDWYKFLATSSGSSTVTLRSEGLSLLAGQLAIFDASLDQIGLASTNSFGSDFSIHLNALTPGATYFIRVSEAPNTPFAAGEYELRVLSEPGEPEVLTLGGVSPHDDNGSNDSTWNATTLTNNSANGGVSYGAFAKLRSGDTDVYRVQAPNAGLNQENVMIVSVRAFGDIAPKIRVLNLLGLPVQADVQADGNGHYTIRVDRVASGANYFLEVTSRNGQAGDYDLKVDYRSVVTTSHTVASGLLTFLNPKSTGSIQVSGSIQLYFKLSSAFTPIVGPSVVLTVFDSKNRVAFRLLARAGDTVDGVALLGKGSYRVEIKANGNLLPSLLSAYSLETALLTDPVGVKKSDPNKKGNDSGNQITPNSEPSPAGYNYYNDRGYYVWGEKTPTSNG